jgi:DtxR family Mn-dependent transcriptional regulator
MSAMAGSLTLTAALEDYLETIFEVIQDRKVARVRDIAQARQVKPGSVTPALKRLEDMGMIRYERREYITLTDDGVQVARRVHARHHVLVDFFTQILKMDPASAEKDACAMEHHLSDGAMDRLVSLFEFMQTCPDKMPTFLQEFHTQALSPGSRRGQVCHGCIESKECGAPPQDVRSLAALQPGDTGRVSLVNASGAIRQRLLDMGMLPGALIQVERTAPSGDPIWVRLHGYQLSLRKREAEAIQVSA